MKKFDGIANVTNNVNGEIKVAFVKPDVENTYTINSSVKHKNVNEIETNTETNDSMSLDDSNDSSCSHEYESNVKSDEQSDGDKLLSNPYAILRDEDDDSSNETTTVELNNDLVQSITINGNNDSALTESTQINVSKKNSSKKKKKQNVNCNNGPDNDNIAIKVDENGVWTEAKKIDTQPKNRDEFEIKKKA